MTTFEIERAFAKRATETTEGFAIGKVDLKVTGLDVMTLNGVKLPDASIEYLLTFALQSLQDAYAGAKTEAEAKGAFEKKLKAVQDGTVGVRTGGGGIDPLTKVMRQVAAEIIKAKLVEAGRKTADYTKKDAADKVALCDKLIEADRKTIEAEAKKRMAAKNTVKVDVDLDDLLA